MSALTEAIESRRFLVGTLVSIASSALVDALSQSGLDWLFFDLEHSVLTLAETQTMIQSMHPGCLSFIRLEDPGAVYVKKALDTGCSGIIVPQVNSTEIARAIVAAGKYPPLGARSVGLGRNLGYGSALTEKVKTENDRTAIVLQIEHRDAVEAVEEIAALEGVDGLFIGPYDLSGSFGIPGNIDDSRVQTAIQRVIEAGRQQNKPVGIFVPNAESARKQLAKGITFVAVGADVARLVTATKAMCTNVRQ